MENGHEKVEKRVPALIVPPEIVSKPNLTCHRFYAPVVIPEPDPLNPRNLNVRPRLGSFDCIKERCTLWNIEAQECRDVTDSKSRAIIAEYAFAKSNDVHIQTGAS